VPGGLSPYWLATCARLSRRVEGERVAPGTSADAASFGTVVLVATPFDALPQVGADYSPLMQGKVVICCSNPSRNNPSPLSQDALERGSGVVSAELFPGVRLTRAFNAINFRFVESEAHRPGEKVGIPVAGDDEDAVRVTSEHRGPMPTARTALYGGQRTPR